VQKIFQFSTNFKIKKKSDIKYLINYGTREKCCDFVIISKSNIVDNDRVAILISRKVGNAIIRNKIKRIFREIFRTEIKRNPPFYDILIQIRPGIKIHNRLQHQICFRKWIEKSKTN
jgi:ribonuclease P protein component